MAGKPATKAEKRRWAIMQDIGCIACIIEGEQRGTNRRQTPPDMHHLIDGYRKGHAFTVALCPWHHRGVPPSEYIRPSQCEEVIGPSLAKSSKEFHARYGTDDELMVRQEREISEWMTRHGIG